MLAFSALADTTRFHIIEMLAKNGRMSVGQIGDGFSVSAPAISQHLKVLKEARLVRVEIQAQKRFYSLNPSGVGEIEDWVLKTKQLWEKRLDALGAVLLEETAQASQHQKRKKHGKSKRG